MTSPPRAIPPVQFSPTVRDAMRAFVGAWAVAVLDGNCEVGRIELNSGRLHLRAEMLKNGKLHSHEFAHMVLDFAQFPFDWTEIGAIKGAHMAECVRAEAGK